MPQPLKICCFDLETSGLDAGFSTLLLGCIKPMGKPVCTFRADDLNAEWDSKRADDSKVVGAVALELAKYDIWVAHNGLKFDVPFLKTRLLRWGLPPLAVRKLIDPVLLCRKNLALSYNSLKRVLSVLGLPGKTEVCPRVWHSAMFDGDSRAMDKIEAHCKRDACALEAVMEALAPYLGNINTLGSAYP